MINRKAIHPNHDIDVFNRINNLNHHKITSRRYYNYNPLTSSEMMDPDKLYRKNQEI
jgi:hypothetical protein